MKYKHYILNNKKADTKETFREYCEQYAPEEWKQWAEEMKQRYVTLCFADRYAIQWNGGDLLSRMAVYNNIGETELFEYLTDEDIRKYGLCVDEYGEFYFTEEQARIANVMYVLMRRYILAFPSVEPLGFKQWVIDDADSGEAGGYPGFIEFHCPICRQEYSLEDGQYGWTYGDDIPFDFCSKCGTKLKANDEKGLAADALFESEDRNASEEAETEDSYRVTFKMGGKFLLYGYADTLEQALVLEKKCREEGWLIRKVSHYDEETGVWVDINPTGD